MKKIVALLLVAIMALSLAACGGKDNQGNAGNEQGSNNGQSTAQNADNSSGTSNHKGSDKLVVNDGSKLGVLQPVAEQQDFVIKGLYISSESRQPDLFNVFFTANGKVCYMVQLNLIAEGTVE